MKTKIAVAVLMAMASGAAWSAETGVYFGASIGWSEVTSNTKYKESDSDGYVYSEKSDFSGSDFAYNIFLGYDFNKYVGVEVGYLDLGQPSDTYKYEDEGGTYKDKVDVSLHGMDLAVIARYPFADNFDVHGKLGVVWWTPRITDKYTEEGFDYWEKTSIEQDATDLMYGVGIGYTFDEHLVLSADWQNFELSGFGDFIGGNTSAYMFGAAWKF